MGKLKLEISVIIMVKVADGIESEDLGGKEVV